MANMFSGNQEKKIPKDFSECYKTDNIAKNLWIWCERLEKYGRILFFITIIIGISQTIAAIDVIDKYTAEAIDIIMVIVDSLLSTILYAFIEYIAYHVIALLVGSLASIVQHTKITANVSLYSYVKHNHDEVLREINEKKDIENLKKKKAEEEIKKKKEEMIKKKKEQENKMKLLEEKQQKEYNDMIEKILFCENCGADISSDKTICHVCGEKIIKAGDGNARQSLAR